MAGHRHWIFDTNDCEGGSIGVSGFVHGVTDQALPDHFSRALGRAPEQALPSVNGAFSGCLVSGDTVTVFCDRFGCGKAYIAELPGRMVAGSSFNDVVRKLDSVDVDRLGVIEFIRFGYPLEDRTFATQVRALKPGTVASYSRRDGARLNRCRYWDYDFTEHPVSDPDARGDELLDVLQGAVRRCFNETDGRYVIGNSGGIDSRAILAMAPLGDYDVTAYTLGAEGTDATTVAGRVAGVAGVPQVRCDITSDFIPRHAERHLEVRPMITLASAWYCCAMDSLPGYSVNITGIFGDNTLGIHLLDKYSKMATDDKLYAYHGLIDDAKLAPFVRGSLSDVRDHFQETLAPAGSNTDVNRFDRWNFENRQFRFVMEEDWVSFLDTAKPRFPFMDNDVVDVGLGLPFAWRAERRLFQKALTKRYPDLAGIRLERHPYAISDGPRARKAKMVAWRLARRIERRTGTRLVFRGDHKYQRSWLLAEPNLSFLEDAFRRPCPALEEIVDLSAMAGNARELIKSNWSVASNVLTVKLWLERFIGC